MILKTYDVNLQVFDVRHEKIEQFARKGILVVDKGAQHFEQVLSCLKIAPQQIKVRPAKNG